MKPQYQHELMTSFLLWFDHELLQEGEAYSNKTGTLFIKSDSRLPSSFTSIQSNYKQWVNDSSITGEVNPIIASPSSILNDGSQLDRSDHIYDYENYLNFSQLRWFVRLKRDQPSDLWQMLSG